MKKELTQSIKVLAISLIIGAATFVAYGETWVEPGCDPLVDPAPCNTTTPINGRVGFQTKSGSLNFIKDTGDGAIITDILSIFGTSYFAGDVQVGNLDASPATTSSNLNITGKLGINLDEGVAVTPAASVALDLQGTARFSDLSQNENPDATYPAPVCITESGKLYLCPGPGELVAGVSATPTITNQDVVLVYEYPGGIDGPGWDHHCSADVSFSSSVEGGTAPFTYLWKVKNNSGAPLILINNLDASDNIYHGVGSGTTTSFSVDEKNPHVNNHDDWTVQLSVTDGGGEVGTTTQNFEVWSIEDCAD